MGLKMQTENQHLLFPPTAQARQLHSVLGAPKLPF